MKMTEKEYKELINIFRYLNDKVEDCYKRETDRAVEEFEEEYKKYIVWFLIFWQIKYSRYKYKFYQ